MKNDDDKLKELFEMKEEKNFGSIIRRAKLLSIIRNVVVSFMIFIIGGFLVLVVNATTLNSMSNKKEWDLRTWYSIAMPNAYLGEIQVDDRFMMGEIDYIRYRFLGNKPITDGSYKEGYTYMPLINGVYGYMGDSLFYSGDKASNGQQQAVRYNKAGKKVMQFYHPSIEYGIYRNELEDIVKEDGTRLMETSLSFDKGYSIDEVKSMIPKDITLNWYWVDTQKDDVKDNPNRIVYEENDVYGIKALDKTGNTIEDPAADFINAINMGRKNKDNSQVYEELFKTLSGGKSEIEKEGLKVIGVVVSGEVQALKALSGKSYIKAATVGASANKY